MNRKGAKDAEDAKKGTNEGVFWFLSVSLSAFALSASLRFRWFRLEMR